jgi:hypothetical protein
MKSHHLSTITLTTSNCLPVIAAITLDPKKAAFGRTNRASFVIAGVLGAQRKFAQVSSATAPCAPTQKVVSFTIHQNGSATRCIIAQARIATIAMMNLNRIEIAPETVIEMEEGLGTGNGTKMRGIGTETTVGPATAILERESKLLRSHSPLPH